MIRLRRRTRSMVSDHRDLGNTIEGSPSESLYQLAVLFKSVRIASYPMYMFNDETSVKLV